MKLHELFFQRKFSVNLYQTLKLPVGEMSMYKDWVNDQRGDPYPVLHRRGDMTEQISDASYLLTSEEGGEITRLLGAFFPYYTYAFQIAADPAACDMGLTVCDRAGERRISVMLCRGQEIVVQGGDACVHLPCRFSVSDTVIVTFRAGGVSIYADHGNRPELIGDVPLDLLTEYLSYRVHASATVGVTTRVYPKGKAAYRQVESYLCGGISQADMKPMTYEDGTPVMEGGRLFITFSARLEVGCYQGIMSWNPSLCDFRMEGAMFFDTGDGQCCNDVAASVVYDRRAREWYLWVCSFSHGHVLARGRLKGDPRYGIQIVDVALLPTWDGADRTAFAGIKGDEDPDLALIDGKWHLTVCRLEPEDGYHYYRFVSDSPLDGFTFADRTPTGGKTGGLMIPFEGKYYFACGTDFKSRALYDVYPYDDFSRCDHLKCNFDDGGFRGWGSVIGVDIGSRKRYFWITFDRHNGSGYNWSYGNIYVYEAEEYFA
ncbi:MAG: hypothetical protein IJW99_04125 [Clostridia bacterium]|nr:hypothetical protein [Clostridia bacterium]